MGRDELFASHDLEGTWREDLAMEREGEGRGHEEQGTRREEQGTTRGEPFGWLAGAYATREAAAPSAPRSRCACRKVSLSLNTLAMFIPLRTAPKETLPVASASPRPK